MSKSYTCDMCGEKVDGDAETRVKTTNFVVAINYLPEVVNSVSWYLHDLCKPCSDYFVKVWRERREKRG